MEEVLGDMYEKDWTMKRFLANLCVLKKISGYTHTHTHTQNF